MNPAPTPNPRRRLCVCSFIFTVSPSIQSPPQNFHAPLNLLPPTLYAGISAFLHRHLIGYFCPSPFTLASPQNLNQVVRSLPRIPSGLVHSLAWSPAQSYPPRRYKGDPVVPRLRAHTAPSRLRLPESILLNLSFSGSGGNPGDAPFRTRGCHGDEEADCVLVRAVIGAEPYKSREGL